MAVRVIVDVKAKPGTGGEVVAFFRSILPETRAYEGCTGVHTLQNHDDPDNVMLVEEWESHAQHKEYLAWQRERGTSSRLIEALAEQPSVRYFDVTDA